MKNPVTPCEQNPDLKQQILDFAETLKAHAHELGDHGLSQVDFYQSGLFRGAIERIRGQFSATMKIKRAFVANVLEHMKEHGFIHAWDSAGDANRHDYIVELKTGKISAVEIKGCLDGNNTNIFQRPPNANEFIIWSLCQNQGADPRHNAWSGIHTRLSAEIIDQAQVVDGLIIWDMLCGTAARPCPKVGKDKKRFTKIGEYILPPPCIYLFPPTVPAPRNNPTPNPHKLEDVGFLKALSDCFNVQASEISSVLIEVKHEGAETLRQTTILRDDNVILTSQPTPIRRS